MRFSLINETNARYGADQRILPGFENRCIALDDRYGAWLATRHLIQQGHTRIGYLCSNHSISDAEDRLQGYYDALAESGIAPMTGW